MKNLNTRCPLFIVGASIFLGCSSDENKILFQKEFLSAKVNGEEYSANNSDLIECKKLLTNYGSINLTVKVITEEGKIMEFLIMNYDGSKVYNMGERTYFGGNSSVNGNWMKYSESSPAGVWSTTKNEYISDQALLEITNDDGNFLNGTFSFNAQDETRETTRFISEGNFSIEIDR